MKAEKIYKFIEPHVNKENIRDLIDILVDECIDTRDFYRAGAKYGLESERIIFRGYDKILKDLKSKLDSSEDSKTKILEEKMREILFRGQRVDAKEWVYGYLYKEGSQSFILKGGRHYPDVVYGQSPLGILDWCEVIPETVGQFTGHTDKNSVKIFEGDLYTAFGSNPYEIRFVNGSICGGIFDGDDSMFSPLGWASPDYDEELYIEDEIFKIIEVIGNIHDNTELLP